MKSHEPIHILMVDDEEVLCEGVRRVLRDYRVEVVETKDDVGLEFSGVYSGEDCLTHIQERHPDIILLDYKLPAMDGLEVLQEIARRGFQGLVIMITAFASLETAVRATKLGAYDFLPKPFTPDELRYVIRKAVAQVVLSQRARAHEEEKKRIRFEFLSVLAHELKAPLNAVEGYLDLLQDQLEGQNRMMIERSLVRIGGMRRLIFDLLDLTRIESGQKTRELSPINIVPLIENTIEALTPQAKRRGISFVRLGATEATFLADTTEIEIIANNLLSNAVKYNRDGGTVETGLEIREGSLYWFVRDTGIGIKPEDQEKVFGEFIRIRNEATQGIEGSGLGLSTVNKLVKLYNGEITIDSRWGEGTTFFLTLRAVPQSTDV